MRPSSARRSSRDAVDQLSKAARAAATARSTSAAEPAEIRVNGCSVDGIDDVERRRTGRLDPPAADIEKLVMVHRGRLPLLMRPMYPAAPGAPRNRTRGNAPHPRDARRSP